MLYIVVATMIRWLMEFDRRGQAMVEHGQARIGFLDVLVLLAWPIIEQAAPIVAGEQYRLAKVMIEAS